MDQDLKELIDNKAVPSEIIAKPYYLFTETYFRNDIKIGNTDKGFILFAYFDQVASKYMNKLQVNDLVEVIIALFDKINNFTLFHKILDKRENKYTLSVIYTIYKCLIFIECHLRDIVKSVFINNLSAFHVRIKKQFLLSKINNFDTTHFKLICIDKQFYLGTVNKMLYPLTVSTHMNVGIEMFNEFVNTRMRIDNLIIMQKKIDEYNLSIADKLIADSKQEEIPYHSFDCPDCINGRCELKVCIDNS